jgi:hypothetical protein
MRAIYRLRQSIAGFDFFHWLVYAKAKKATEIVFDIREPKTNKFDLATVMRRFESILLPGPALAGMEASIGTEFDIDLGVCDQRKLNHHVSNGGKFEPLRSVLPPGPFTYTITMRKFDRWPNRNSNESAWLRFGDEIGAKIIPDYEEVPIHLHERMALYAGAEMNFFVTNGPVSLCFLSDYPAAGFDVQKSKPTGIPDGGQYPFLGKDQFQIWQPDEYSNIRSWFDAWRRRR